jgi:hypothetical protein
LSEKRESLFASGTIIAARQAAQLKKFGALVQADLLRES